MQMTLSTDIAAARESVFGALADLPRWPERISGITRLELLTEGPVRVGTRFRETRVMFGRPATEEMTVAELAPPDRLVLTAANHGTDCRIVHVLTTAGERTRLTLTFEGLPRTLAARLLAPIGMLMKRTVRNQIARDLSDLRRSIEPG